MKRFPKTVTISVIILLFFFSGFAMIYGHINRFLPKSKIHIMNNEEAKESDEKSVVSSEKEKGKEGDDKEAHADQNQKPSSDDTGSVPIELIASQKTTQEDRAGKVERFSFDELTSGQVFSVDMSGEQYTAFAFRWSEGKLFFGFSPDSSFPKLTQVEEDDEWEGSENEKISLLYTPDSDKGNNMILYSETTVTGLEISLINPSDSVAQTRGGFNTQLNYDSGASYSSLPIISRDEWGAELTDIDDPSHLSWDPYYYHANRIIIHHTVTPNEPEYPEVYVRAVYLYHKNTKGWGDVGYNYLIDHLGNIYEGKLGGDEVKGYHAGSQANRGSIGISLLGNFEEKPPTPAAKNALIQLMAEKAAFYKFDLKYGKRNIDKWINNTYSVFGHKDAFNLSSDVWTAEATSCPGIYFYELLPTLVKKAQEYKLFHFSRVKDIALEAEKNFARNHQADKLYVVYNLPENVDKQTVLDLIPSFSGITERGVQKNMAVITVRDWDNGGYVPPASWDRYITESEQTYFPESEGTEDRLKTLYKIFRLDRDVKHVGLSFLGSF